MTSFNELISTISLQVIEETLSPTWDESMVFEEVLVYGRREDIKANPPIIIVETYDQDKVRASDMTSSSLSHHLHCTLRLGRQSSSGAPRPDPMSTLRRRSVSPSVT